MDDHQAQELQVLRYHWGAPGPGDTNRVPSSGEPDRMRVYIGPEESKQMDLDMIGSSREG